MNPILALIIANLIWGAAAPIFKYSLSNIPPFTLAFLRFFFAALIFIPFLKNFHFKELPIKDWFKLVLAGFFGITVNITFFFLGLQMGTSINAPIIASAGPIFLFIAAVVFLHEKFKKRVFLGMSVALAGTFFIVFSPIIFNGKKPENLGIFTGNLFFLIATMGAILDPLIVKNVLKKIQPYKAVFINFLFASLTFFPLMLFEQKSWSFSKLALPGIVGIVFGVFFSSALAYFFYYYGISKIAAQEVGVFAYIDPIVAVLIAMPLVQEYPNLYFLIGSSLILLGIFIAEGRIHYHPVHRLKTYTKLKLTLAENDKIQI